MTMVKTSPAIAVTGVSPGAGVLFRALVRTILGEGVKGAIHRQLLRLCLPAVIGQQGQPAVLPTWFDCLPRW